MYEQIGVASLFQYTKIISLGPNEYTEAYISLAFDTAQSRTSACLSIYECQQHNKRIAKLSKLGLVCMWGLS